ncbi:hypothetical protein BTO14_16450 [Polaribacter butkevichii]|uniref:Uncharacterized protein n=2 Tax=Polaribacter butkevichii TaxID=218490 RepID=A0A2P6C9J6_9FLAO|nr:hypothetical protein BTO14_16450 [Polaribacter butkevichii]
MSCKGIDEITEDIDIIVKSSIFKQQIVIEVFDPVNQLNLEGDNILQVEVIGKDADKIVTDAGNNVNSAKVVGGTIALAVNPNKNPSNETVEFLVKITGDQYLTTTIPIVLSPTDSIASISANVVNKLNTAQGIDYKKTTETLTNNTLTKDFIFETSGLKAGTNTEITIKSGTIFKDENGNDISGTEIESELVHFNSANSESLDSFPGGFMPAEITDENGDILNNAYFITAGFASINMTIGNKEVKNFSKPISIKMKIDANFINPDTGIKIKKGDTIPIWSYSKDDGKWDFHKDGVVKVDNNNLIIEYTTTHLSWYNLDYKGTRCSSYSPSGVAKINISMSGVNNSNGYRLFSDFFYENGNQPISPYSGKTFSWYDGQTFEINNAPVNRKVQLIVYSGSNRYDKGEILFRSEAVNLCNVGSVDVDVSNIVSKLPPLPVNVNVNYQGKCNRKIIAPTIPLYMKKTNYYGRTYWSYLGYVYDGKITIRNINLNKEYEFRTYFNGQYFYQNISFDKTEYINDSYEIPSDLCDRLF